MLRTTLLTTTVLLTLSGCARVADSRFNPLNWFGSATSAPSASTETRPLVPQNSRTITVDGRALLQSVTSLSVDRAAGGAIVRATGVAPTQGYFNAQLVNAGVSNGVLTLEFRAQAPDVTNPAGSEQSREITAAYIIDANELADIRDVRVQTATNTRTASR